MAKLKKDLVLVIVCSIFILSTIVLAAQKNALIAKQKTLQSRVGTLAKIQVDLKTANAKLAQQKRGIDDANAAIQTLRKEKEDLLKQLEELKNNPLGI
jgi:cell shape-determining protein MreC